MAEAQNLAINLDEASIDILRKVNKIHRDSLINVGLALVKQTGYYKTLAGIAEAETLDDVASLDIEPSGNKEPKTSKASGLQKKVDEKPARPVTTWDSF